MNLDRVLVLYKKSAYKIYFVEKSSSFNYIKHLITKKEVARFKRSHNQHYASLKHIAYVLFKHGIRFTESYRGRGVNYDNYDLIITVGGDGTFLEASRKIKHQHIIGVNSAPDFSIGRFCIANKDNFEKILLSILKKKYQVKKFQRLRVDFDREHASLEALNDVLVCQRNPAMLSRYYINVNRHREEQRSSGIWISTPAGSTGGIYSAGGKVMKPYEKKFQFLVRELFHERNRKFKNKKGVLQDGKSITITSLMRTGMVYFDGAHQRHVLDYGNKIRIQLSKHPIKTISCK